MTTIRALMLAQQQRHFLTEAGVCFECGRPWVCADRVAADAVIAILDAADWQYDKQRLVPDPVAS